MQTAPDLDLARKQVRIPTPLPDATHQRLEALAAQDSRPVANLASALLQAAVELIDQQGFQLVAGKLRKVTLEPDEAESRRD